MEIKSSCLHWPFLVKHSIPVLAHPSYSPDLALWDFFIFPVVKEASKGTYFDTVRTVKKKVTETMKMLIEGDKVKVVKKKKERKICFFSSYISYFTTVFSSLLAFLSLQCHSSTSGHWQTPAVFSFIYSLREINRPCSKSNVPFLIKSGHKKGNLKKLATKNLLPNHELLVSRNNFPI